MELCYCLCIQNYLTWSPARRIYTAAQLGNSWETSRSIASLALVQCLHESQHLRLAPDGTNAHHSHSLPAAACPSPPPRTSAPGWLGSSCQGKTLGPGLFKQRTWLRFSVVPLEVPTITSHPPSGCHTHVMRVKVLYHPPLLFAELILTCPVSPVWASGVGWSWSRDTTREQSQHLENFLKVDHKLERFLNCTRFTAAKVKKQDQGESSYSCFTSVFHICSIKKAHINC